MDVTGGIQFCLDKGFKESDIIVDTLMCVGKYLTNYNFIFSNKNFIKKKKLYLLILF